MFSRESQESVEVNRGPVEGTQLFMFGADAEGARVVDAPRGARAFPRTRSSHSTQRSAYAQFQKRADRENQVPREGSFAAPIARRSDTSKENRVNKVMLTGRLGRNARVRETNGGRLVADFFLGTEEFSKDLRGKWQQKTAWPYGKKTRPGRCTEQELIALRTLMINQAREVFCQGRFPASLI